MSEDKKDGPSDSLSKKPKDVITPELVEVMRSEQNAQVNINVLLVQLTTGSSAPLEAAEKAFELAQKFERGRLESFKARSDAIIDAKNRDPDDIEKRKNNATRRHMKYALVGTATGGLGGGLAVALSGGPIVAAGLLLAVGALAVAMTGPLAAGESVSSNDVVRIIGSMRNLFFTPPEEQKGKKK